MKLSKLGKFCAVWSFVLFCAVCCIKLEASLHDIWVTLKRHEPHFPVLEMNQPNPRDSMVVEKSQDTLWENLACCDMLQQHLCY